MMTVVEEMNPRNKT